MKKFTINVFVLIIFTMLPIVMCAMDTIPVVETTLYSKGEQEMYYGFAKGDKIVIDFSGYLSYISITFMPDMEVYKDYGLTEISKKTITVTKEGIYKFYFATKPSYKKDGVKYNVEKQRLKIQRIPKDESTIDFNTACRWETVNDTTFINYTADSLVGYDTIKYQEKVKEIDATTIEEVNLIDNVETVKSRGIIDHDNPHTKIFISLPRNEKTEYKTKKVTAWAYVVAVVNDPSNSQLINNVSKGAGTVIGAFTAASPISALGELAVGGIMKMALPKDGDNVKYAIVDQQNAELFMHGQAYRAYKSGNGPSGYGRFTDENMCKGSWYLCLYNDNEHNKINVSVKVSAIVETTTYKDVFYDREKVTPKYVKVNRVKANITPKRVMVNVKD